jgi:hypothetical protein
MTYPNKMRLPSMIYSQTLATMSWLANRPPIVQITDDQHKWFTHMFQGACTFSPEYKELEAHHYSLEYDEKKGIELVLFNSEMDEVGRIPVMEDDKLEMKLPTEAVDLLLEEELNKDSSKH